MLLTRSVMVLESGNCFAVRRRTRCSRGLSKTPGPVQLYKGEASTDSEVNHGVPTVQIIILLFAIDALIVLREVFFHRDKDKRTSICLFVCTFCILSTIAERELRSWPSSSLWIFAETSGVSLLAPLMLLFQVRQLLDISAVNRKTNLAYLTLLGVGSVLGMILFFSMLIVYLTYGGPGPN
jgi:hypothetical protein